MPLKTFIGYASALITLVALFSLSIFITKWLGDYYVKQKESELVDQARDANGLFGSYLKGQQSYDKLEDMLKNKDHLQNLKIFVVPKGPFSDKLAPFTHPSESVFTASELSQAEQGKVITKVSQPNPKESNRVISIVTPLTVDGKVAGVISIHSPLNELQESLPEIYRFIWTAALLVTLIAFVLTYWLSRGMCRPLKEFSGAAMEIAGGSFHKEVKVPGTKELAQLAESFNHMARELHRLEGTRREFMANVSHELRSPLTSLGGGLQVLVDDTVPKEQRKRYLKIALEETNRLTRLVNELLDLATVQSSDFRLNVAEVNLNELIRRVLAKMEPQIVSRQMDVEVSLVVPDPVIKADWDRLQQVMVNLVDNAVAFSPDGGRLLLTTAVENQQVKVVLADSGMGIPQEELPMIWERFHKVDKSRNRARKGTGLGLSIVKRLVESHGGIISVESQVGVGTTFTVFLPKQL